MSSVLSKTSGIFDVLVGRYMKPPQTTRFFYEGAQATLIQDDHGLCVVDSLYSRTPGQGHARGVMERIIRHADQNGLTLRLIARQFGNPHGLRNDELVVFYEKFGFVIEGDRKPPITMVRPPSQESQPL